ncbi:hypothetical protein SAMN04487775_101461 [Treponema bryantii]|uniref:Uncharacterized protein n=2 Tax=Treponema bryantii TaxID=163 RepID=A0A1I3IAV9_9SPIR|nr:hypothetical protein SAMN04487775_101461 [Treponema bryantii]
MAPFLFCEKLLNINVDENNNDFSSINGVLFSKDKKTLIEYPDGKKGKYIVPDTVNTIESYVFAELTGENLTAIEIPNSVKYISPNAISCISIIFNDTNGWYYTSNKEDWLNMTNGTAMPDLSDPEKNVVYLTEDYSNYYLYKLSANN